MWYILGKRLHRYLFPAQKIYDTDFIGCLGRCLWFLGNNYYYISLLPRALFIIFHWLPRAMSLIFRQYLLLGMVCSERCEGNKGMVGIFKIWLSYLFGIHQKNWSGAINSANGCKCKQTMGWYRNENYSHVFFISFFFSGGGHPVCFTFLNNYPAITQGQRGQ